MGVPYLCPGKDGRSLPMPGEEWALAVHTPSGADEAIHRNGRSDPVAAYASHPSDMRPLARPSDTLSGIIRSQNGIITVRQALDEGFPYASIRRQVRSGNWQRLTQGVLLAGQADPTLEQLCAVGVIRGGASAAIGGWAGAGLCGLRVTSELPTTIDVWVPEGHNRRPTGSWRFHEDGQGRLAGASGRPPVISVEHLICDLTIDLNETEIIDLVTNCLSRRLTDERTLIAVVDRRPRLSGRRFLIDLLHDSGGLDSVLEYRFDDRVLKPHDLPTGARQAARSGFFHDLLYEAFALIIELDGRLGHTGSAKFRDFRRDNVGAVNGRVTLRYGWDDVMSRPCAVAGELATVLRRQGWQGRRAYCPRCR
ncbi:type IV toxin-antitoxin system AbiEi family antitoxin domain-containing protein [Raineyella sp. LH-20]|uniref:type IV toxin-antitoxin system AbiEi family antitoxin domain-containing protein n=1 Tax=Raineyella sp. LH-20 TaxID=3081204 RepID=UPI00295352FC|nr:type IV toxin-antitoxin system AbiEi family antitoxin domain-containing protein [Raineyella sp. LH-20]WOP17679.1 type IV toxin-antitoxin system AbiEi family antitoxin domain-containing protein [Raineyella sp. LH-20]